jgi:hypothetical protein
MSNTKLYNNILFIKPPEFAQYLSKKQSEFNKIADSGYGLYWFPNSLYCRWKEIDKDKSLDLWGNMGAHYTSNIVSQFSEVSEHDDRPVYLSNIFLFCLIGSHKRIQSELSDIIKYISNKPLPYQVFLIRFDKLKQEDDVNWVKTDILFKDLIWVDSFQVQMNFHLYQISISSLENTIENVVIANNKIQ